MKPAGLTSSPRNRQFMLAKSWVLPAMALGLATTLAWYGCLIALRKAGIDSSSFNYLFTLFTDRGTIPYLLTFGFFVGLALLLIRVPMLVFERRAIVREEATLRDMEFIGQPEIAEMEERLCQSPLLVSVHLHRAIQLARTATDGAEMDAGMANLSQLERMEMDASHSLVRYLIWLIPTLGFIGTVLGISYAVNGFATVVSSSAEFSELQGTLVDVCRNLGIAFETTLIALVFSAFIAGTMAVVDRNELQLMNDLDGLCSLVLRPKLTVVLMQSRQAGQKSFNGGNERASNTTELLSAVAPSPNHLGGGGTGTVIILRSDGKEVDLVQVAEQAVVASIARLEESGRGVYAALSDASAGARLAQFVEVNLVRLEQMNGWVNQVAVRREDIESLKSALEIQSAAVTNASRELTAQILRQDQVLAGMQQLLGSLHKDGVKSHVSISSVVSPAPGG